MKLLNLINSEKSEIKYKLTHFPDGEPQISFTEELNRKDSIKVLCRITSSEELLLVIQVGDILDRQEIEWSLAITYLMSMRMDRVMDFNRPFSLKVVCSILNNMHYQTVSVLEAHSKRTESLLGSRFVSWSFDYRSLLGDQVNIVFPDAGSYERLKDYASVWGYLIFSKIRNIETGKIESFSVDASSNCYYSTFTFVDDLCDGGGTFLGELATLKERSYPNHKFNIVICHAVNELGINRLCDSFDKVTISNSYKDWNITRDNLTIIDVCK